MTSEIASVVRELGWDNTYSLPTANSENTVLEAEIQDKTEECEKVGIDLKTMESRLSNVKDHLKNIKSEFSQTQQLIKACRKEMEAEDHMFQLAYREDDWLAQNMERQQANLKDLEEKYQRHESLVIKQRERLDEMNVELRLDEKSLITWLDEVSKHDDDILALQRYSKQDDTKMRELIIQVRGLAGSLEAEKQKLSNLVTEYRCCQMEMNKTAEEYSQLHEERHNLIKQWELAIKQMKDRDREIDGILKDMTQVKTELQSKTFLEETKTRFLNQLTVNNQEVESAMLIADRDLVKHREEHKTLKIQMALQSDDLRTVSSQVCRSSGDLATMKEEIKHWKELLFATKDKQTQQKERIEELQKAMTNIKGDLMTTEEKADLSHKHYQNTELRHKQLEFDLNRMMELRYRKSAELEKVKDSEKTLSSEIQGCRTSIQNQIKRLRSLEKMAQRQEEVIYGQDVVIQQLEDRISRITGNTRAEEKKALETKVSQLEETLERKETSTTFLNQQIKLLEEDIVRVKRDLTKQKNEQQELNVKMKDLEMEIETANHELKNLTTKKQNLIVEENMLKLHIKKLKEELMTKADDVLNLEKQKLELEQVAKEHQKDIEVQQDMLRLQFTTINDERHFLATELNNHKAEITKLKNRYEVLVSSMVPCAEVPDDDMTCHVHYFIKAVQEKQRLQLEGDQLDEKVLTAEREVVALENTLKVMNSSNDNLRRAFNPVMKSSEDYEDRQKLEEQVRLSKERQIMKKRARNDILNEVEQLVRVIESLDLRENRLDYNCRDLRDHLSNLGRRMEEQYAKLDRANLQNSKYIKILRPKEEAKKKMKIEFDIDLRIIRDANKSLLKSIEATQVFKGSVIDMANKLLGEADLPLLNAPLDTREQESSISLSSRYSYCSSHGNTDTSDIDNAQGIHPQSAPIVTLSLTGIPTAKSVVSLPADGAKNTECSISRMSTPAGVCSFDEPIVGIKCETAFRAQLKTRKCGSETIQLARAQRVREARKAPPAKGSKESLRQSFSSCSLESEKKD